MEIASVLYWIIPIVVVLAVVLFFSKKKDNQTVVETNEEEPQNDEVKFNKVESLGFLKDSKDVVEMSDVVAYFKGLLGKIKKGEDTPFISKAEYFLKLVQGVVVEKPESTLFLATFNEKTEVVENVLILEYNSLGESLKNVLSKSKNGIVTLS